MRLRLAQLMYQDVNLLILDEPTNHLDIESREVLEDALEYYMGTILAVSHDRYFLNKLFDKTYWIMNQTLYSYSGNYDWAKEKVQEYLQKTSVKQMPIKKQIPIDSHKKTGKTTEDHSKRIEEIERKLEEVEIELHLIDQKMTLEQDLAVLQALFDEKKDIENVRDVLYESLDVLLS